MGGSDFELIHYRNTNLCDSLVYRPVQFWRNLMKCSVDLRHAAPHRFEQSAVVVDGHLQTRIQLARGPREFEKNLDGSERYRLGLGQPVHFLQNLREVVEAYPDVRMICAQVLLKYGLRTAI